jgi:soluble lytic murein transglycosylase-like protein
MRVLVTACLLGSALMLSACQTTSSDKGVDKSTKTSSVKKSTTKKTTSKSSAVGYTALPYDKLIQKHAKKNGVPVSLARAVVKIESNYNANARGAAGEVGLMQIKPATARGMGYSGSTKNLYHPENNIAFGMKYLGEAYRRGGGTTCGAILKYNAGHYAKRMNPVSAKYCQRVKAILK